MIHQASIELSEVCIRAILDHTGNKKELLFGELMHHIIAIQRMLSDYYYEDRGEVHDLRLKKDSFVFDNHQAGHLSVGYFIRHFMGCQDLTYDAESGMLLLFEIDIATNILKLTGENIRERDPDSY